MSRIRDITVVPVADVPVADVPVADVPVADVPAHAAGPGKAGGLIDACKPVLVMLQTEDGVEGIGEAWGPPGLLRAALDLVRPLFNGTTVFGQRGVAQTLLATSSGFALQTSLVPLLGGIDVAAHDAIGKQLGVSVAELLGGRRRERVPVYAAAGDFTAGDDQDFVLEAQLDQVRHHGFGAFRIRIGRAPADDLMRVRMARRLIGEGPLLTVDANGVYSADLALQSMRRIAPFNVLWYAEPLAPDDWGGAAELARRAPLPVASGGALMSLADVRRLVDGRLASVVQPDLARCGGFEMARTVAVLAAAERLRLSPRCRGTGVGLAAALQWVAALPGTAPTLVEYEVGANARRDELLAEKLQLRDGMLDVPTGPGLGIALDPEALKRLSTL